MNFSLYVNMAGFYTDGHIPYNENRVRLDDLVIRGKTFTIVQQFERPYNRKKKIAGKPS